MCPDVPRSLIGQLIKLFIMIFMMQVTEEIFFFFKPAERDETGEVSQETGSVT